MIVLSIIKNNNKHLIFVVEMCDGMASSQRGGFLVCTWLRSCGVGRCVTGCLPLNEVVSSFAHGCDVGRCDEMSSPQRGGFLVCTADEGVWM